MAGITTTHISKELKKLENQLDLILERGKYMEYMLTEIYNKIGEIERKLKNEN